MQHRLIFSFKSKDEFKIKIKEFFEIYGFREDMEVSY